MKIILATGIYPPEIGGPATYVRALAEEFSQLGNEVRVVTYGAKDLGLRTKDEGKENQEGWRVVFVPRSGGPLLRWLRYARVLRSVATDADVVEAFSSVSVGVPLMLARLKHPKKVLRLGGDFFWERYTDRGGMLGLREWYASRPWSQWLTQKILRAFDHVVFSTLFQAELYEAKFALPAHSVIENALPGGESVLHIKHEPFCLLFMGRFVGFKNLPALLEALRALPDARIALVGSGPMEAMLWHSASRWFAVGRVTFLPPVSGADKQRVFAEQDLLILPSLTELSPNVALEARAAGLPVLLSQETGLSASLTQGMVVRPLRTADAIVSALRDIIARYDEIARSAALPAPKRGWEDVAKEHVSLFQSL